jgi:hypothetical protein
MAKSKNTPKAKAPAPIKRVVRAARARPTAAAVEAAAKVVSEAAHQEPTAAWEVLSPFKFRGAVVKPPAWIELTAEEAAPYQAAGVLGTEPGEVPDTDESANGASDAPAANGAGSATDGQGSNDGSAAA